MSRKVQGYTNTHTEAHRVASWLQGDECVPGLVIRKGINMHTLWTSVSFSCYVQHDWSTYNLAGLSNRSGEMLHCIEASTPTAAQPAVEALINGAGWPVQVSLSFSLPVALLECASSGKRVDGPAPPSSSDSTLLLLPAEGRPPVFAVSLRPYGPSYTCSAELTLSCYKYFALIGINTQPFVLESLYIFS